MLWTSLIKAAFRLTYGPPPPVAAPGPGVGLILVADGVGGLDLCGASLRHVVDEARLPMAVEVAGWGHGFGRWHADLTDVANQASKAAEIADQVVEHKNAYPDTPVYLVGKSGGTGVVVRALELLPAGAVEGVALLASALSPGYDLSTALRAVKGEMVAYWSPLDVFVLGVGTTLFGTVDRVHTAAAGLVGFRVPAGADLDRYAKFRQVRWDLSMVSTGYLGGHIGPDCPAFLRKYVLPLLKPLIVGESAAGSSRARAGSIS